MAANMKKVMEERLETPEREKIFYNYMRSCLDLRKMKDNGANYILHTSQRIQNTPARARQMA